MTADHRNWANDKISGYQYFLKDLFSPNPGPLDLKDYLLHAEERNERERQGTPPTRGAFGSAVKAGFLEEVPPDFRPEWREGGSHVTIWRERFPGKGNGQHESSVQGSRLMIDGHARACPSDDAGGNSLSKTPSAPTPWTPENEPGTGAACGFKAPRTRPAGDNIGLFCITSTGHGDWHGHGRFSLRVTGNNLLLILFWIRYHCTRSPKTTSEIYSIHQRHKWIWKKRQLYGQRKVSACSVTVESILSM